MTIDQKIFNAKIFQNRRLELFKKMSAQSIAILPGAKIQHRNDDVEYSFRQDSYFYYLSGFAEPDAICVLIKKSETDQKAILFCKDFSEAEIIWIGHRDSLSDIKQKMSVDEVFPNTELKTELLKLLHDKNTIYYSLGKNLSFDQALIQCVEEANHDRRKGHEKIKTWVDLLPLISELRIIKDSGEMDNIREACRISSLAHQTVLQKIKSAKWEYELEGEFLAACCKMNAREMAYPPIVAAGQNACTLHYVQNNKPLVSGDLLLIDAGCEYQNYASDITRTYPISGRFTEEQKAIYELVLKAQEAAIEIAKPNVGWYELQDRIVEVLVAGLIELKILQGDLKTLINEKAYRDYYMHSSGHWLGLDVHDAGEYKINGQWRPLVPGMVFTIEPGLYFAPKKCEQNNLDKRWWGIGVRIEDDILITKAGCEILTKAIPKNVKEIERIMSENQPEKNNKAVIKNYL